MPISSIRKDPDIMSMISRLPKKTASTLTDNQLRDIKVAIGSGQYRKHKIDIRGTIPVPFYPSRLYFVILLGRNIRSLSRQEQTFALTSVLLLAVVFLLFSASLGVLIIYILKSALGINLLEGYSLGLWDWLNTL